MKVNIMAFNNHTQEVLVHLVVSNEKTVISITFATVICHAFGKH